MSAVNWHHEYKCKDCQWCKRCARNRNLPEFSPENPAYCKGFKLKEPKEVQ